jgi:hypothetical protein
VGLRDGKLLRWGPLPRSSAKNAYERGTRRVVGRTLDELWVDHPQRHRTFEVLEICNAKFKDSRRSATGL